MKYSRWLVLVTFLSILLCSPFIYIAAYNYHIDPLWNFTHSNKYNQYQMPFNERQQKTNLITSNSFNYDALIMGTSRSTYINQHDFEGLKTFNYSTSSMHIYEYNDYIEYAKKQNGRNFEVIFMEVFPKHLEFPVTFEKPEFYIDVANEPFYKYKSLFSFDTYEKAKANYNLSLNPNTIGSRSYNRENIAIAKILDSTKVQENIDYQVQQITIEPDYKYDTEYINLLREIKSNNPNTTFILYSPPYLVDAFLAEFKGDIGFKIYQDWLNDCVEVFGEVHNFMYINSVTIDKSNYYDSHHFYPEIGTTIAKKLLQLDDSTIPVDFGVLVNSNNLYMHLIMLKKQLQSKI